MRKTLLVLSLCLSALCVLTGCVPTGAKNSFCTQEESLQEEVFAGAFQLIQPECEGVPVSSVWNDAEKRYFFEVSAPDAKNEEKKAAFNLQFFNWKNLHYADVSFQDSEQKEPVPELHTPFEAGVIGNTLVLVGMEAEIPVTPRKLEEFGEKYPIYYEMKSGNNPFITPDPKDGPDAKEEHVSYIMLTAETDVLKGYLQTLYTPRGGFLLLRKKEISVTASGIASAKEREAFLLLFLNSQKVKMEEMLRADSISPASQIVDGIEEIYNDDSTWKGISETGRQEAEKICKFIISQRPSEGNDENSGETVTAEPDTSEN